MNFRLLFIVVILICVCCKKANNNETQIWQFVLSADNSEPIKRHKAAFVAVKDKFYLLGGRKIKPVSIFNTKNKNVDKRSETISINTSFSADCV